METIKINIRCAKNGYQISREFADGKSSLHQYEEYIASSDTELLQIIKSISNDIK